MFDSYDDILDRIEDAIRCEETKALVMCFDSPGGDASGAMEAHRSIRRLRKKYGKPIYAYANEAAYSAAYALASAADEIWLPDTGGVGSVGVIMTLMSRSKANEMEGLDVRLITSGKRKADSHIDRPITDKIQSRTQERVDYMARVFWEIVAKSRGMSVEDVAGLQAGVFQGYEAIDAGLADGIAGWDRFVKLIRQALSASVFDDGGIERSRRRLNSEDDTMASKKLLSLIAAKDKAQAAVEGAKTDSERKKLFAAYESAILALAKFEAKHCSEEEEEEEEDMKKSSKAKRAEEEEDSDDEHDEHDEDEDEEEDEESEEEEDEDEDTDGGSDSTSDGDSDSDGDKEEAKAFFGAKTGLYTPARLVRLVRQVTGKSNIREMFGALDAMGIRMKAVAKQERRIARLEDANRRTRVEKLVTKALHEGKITRAQVEEFKAKGMQDPKFLKGFLAGLPKIVRTMKDGPVLPKLDASGNLIGTPSADQAKMVETFFSGLSGEALEKAKEDFASRATQKAPKPLY
jgi:signal peptide peptidase SppA